MRSRSLAQASTVLLLVSFPSLLAVMAALDPGFQRALCIAQKRASCSEMDESHPLCLLPAEPGTGAVGKSITVYSKIGEGCGPEVEAVILFSRNAWYRVEDAASYLKSLGYNVSVQDLSEFATQVSLVVRVYRRVNETKLPNGTLLKGEICEEVAKKACRALRPDPGQRDIQHVLRSQASSHERPREARRRHAPRTGS